MCAFDKSIDQRAKCNPRVRRRFGQKTLRREARHGVDLEKVWPVLRVDHDVDPRKIARADDRIGALRNRSTAFKKLRGQSSIEAMLRIWRLVLRFVIKEFVLGHDANRR